MPFTSFKAEGLNFGWSQKRDGTHAHAQTGGKSFPEDLPLISRMNGTGEGVGAAGKEGQAARFGLPLTLLNKSQKAQFPDEPIEKSCDKHYLGDGIRKLLNHHNFSTTKELLDLHELNLVDRGFNGGQIAEIKWALNKIALDELNTIGTRTGGGKAPDVSGVSPTICATLHSNFRRRGRRIRRTW